MDSLRPIIHEGNSFIELILVIVRMESDNFGDHKGLVVNFILNNFRRKSIVRGLPLDKGHVAIRLGHVWLNGMADTAFTRLLI